MNLIFLGAPGSGKGTQASLLTDTASYKHVSTGDLLRKEIREESELGKRVKAVLDAGDLVDDQLVLDLLNKNCDLANNQYIFDGFPRNAVQAGLLDSKVIKENERKAVFFEINQDLLIERLTNRRTCRDCGAVYNLKFSPPQSGTTCDKCGSHNLEQREDDKEEVIRHRLEVYNKMIDPVLDYYRGKGLLETVDASQGESRVSSLIKEIIRS